GMLLSFAAPVDYTAAGRVRAADLNHDGNVDLIVGDTAHDLVVLLGHGDATFAAGVSIASQPADFSLADVNGDGNLDIVASLGTNNGSIELWLGKIGRAHV